MRLDPWTALLLSAPILGCTGAVSDPVNAGDAETSTTTSAVVIVERAVGGSGGATRPDRAETSARFVRVLASSSTRDALRTIGASLDLPPRASCASIAGLASGGDAAVPAPVVELLDVGAVSLETNGSETRLVPRQLPDVTDVVSGVVYARTADPVLFPAGSRYVVRVSGGPDVDPFEVSASAPADPTDVKASGEEGPAGLIVPAGSAVEITWPAEATEDVLYVDVQPAAFRCTLEDGSGAPGDRARASVPPALIDDAGTLVVHRVHREALVARGLESGELRFDFSRTIPYTRR
jgi:hypothetical protein